MAAVVLPFPRGRADAAAGMKAQVRVAFAEFAVRRWAARVGVERGAVDQLARLWSVAAAYPENDAAAEAAIAFGRSLFVAPRMEAAGS